jgi:biotin carboxyl carrier protein
MSAQPQLLTVHLDKRAYSVEVRSDATLVDGKEIALDILNSPEDSIVRFRSESEPLHAVLDRGESETYVCFKGREMRVRIETERDRLLQKASAGASNVHHHEELKASMPGLVVRILGDVGSEVKRGQPVLILEAMKMENEIRSPVDGLIKVIRVSERQVVEKGDVLVVLE